MCYALSIDARLSPPRSLGGALAVPDDRISAAPEDAQRRQKLKPLEACPIDGSKEAVGADGLGAAIGAEPMRRLKDQEPHHEVRRAGL